MTPIEANDEFYTHSEVDALYENIDTLGFYLNMSLAMNILQALAGIGTLIYWLM